MRSISRFLLISLLCTVLSVTLVASLWSYRDSTHEVEELFDAELAQMARVLQSLLAVQLKRTQLSQLKDALQYRPYIDPTIANPDNTDDDNDEASALGHKYESKLAFVVWNEQGDELFSSSGRGSNLSFSKQPGYGDEALEPQTPPSGQQQQQQQWRSFMLHDSSLNLWIKVAQRHDVREELTGEIVEHTLLPLLLMIPLLGLLIAFVVRRGLSPLRQLSGQLASRTPDHLKPLSNKQLPDEITTVVDAINALMQRLEQAMERERRFSADAAHELRTPLAAIRIHAQNVQQQLSLQQLGPPQQIIDGVDQMSHTIDQLLTLSRLEFDTEQPQQPLDLSRLVRQISAELAPLALDRSQRLELEAADDCTICGNSSALAILIRNLIDNAIRYTPPQGQVQINVESRPGPNNLEQCYLSIHDSGPGIAMTEHGKVMQRFYRLADQAINGSGLGLSIAQQIASQHRATISLSDSPLATTGLSVTVCFDRIADNI
ncbi:MAG: ATP-binding protein [Motiliproteus sp.]